jgi:HAD superfamily hydrolase (TIGR01549 family)
LNDIEEFKAAHGRSTNWRGFYKNEFGFNEQEIDETGVHWTGFQADDETEVPFFNGILEVLNTTRSVPQGIVSQNSSKIIQKQISECELGNIFNCIIGYEEVDLQRQKPHPEGMLSCIGKLTNSDSGTVIYIGDHETDTICVRNANGLLKENGSNLNIVSIAALYDNMIHVEEWDNQPDYMAQSPQDILKIINKLD